MTDVETLDVQKSVAVKVVKDEITVTLPCVLSQEDLCGILEKVKALLLGQVSCFAFVSGNEVIRIFARKYRQYFYFEIRIKYMSVMGTDIYFSNVGKSSLESFCNGISYTDVVFPENIDNIVLFQLDYDPNSVTNN